LRTTTGDRTTAPGEGHPHVLSSIAIMDSFFGSMRHHMDPCQPAAARRSPAGRSGAPYLQREVTTRLMAQEPSWRPGAQARSALTVAACDRDVDDFARWQGEAPAVAIARLLSCTAGQAHQVALHYLEHLQGRTLPLPPAAGGSARCDHWPVWRTCAASSPGTSRSLLPRSRPTATPEDLAELGCTN
jgi:hypothetical protein